MAKQNEWVTIRRTVLEPSERTAQIPEDTAKTPLILWVKGRLTKPAEIGEEATVVTKTGRTENGILEEENPAYRIGYGEYIPELSGIGEQARELLFGGDKK